MISVVRCSFVNSRHSEFHSTHQFSENGVIHAAGSSCPYGAEVRSSSRTGSDQRLSQYVEDHPDRFLLSQDIREASRHFELVRGSFYSAGRLVSVRLQEGSSVGQNYRRAREGRSSQG